MKFCFHTYTVDWLGVKLEIKPVDHYMIDDVIEIGMQPRGSYKENILDMCYAIDEVIEDSELFESTDVLDRTYSKVTAKEVAAQQRHLNKEEQANVEKVLAK
uniref:Uncharacterized protein n=1 Tax=Pseudo-nitzschia australis TaxID=44445 RepID=A0A7S4ARN9_9STRA